MLHYIAQEVEKEDVVKLNFPQKAIRIKTEIEQKQIIKKLERATSLGNLHKNKVTIIFQDSVGLKKVKTTIWATGKENIVLKKGIIIPINRIVEINI